MEAIYPKNLLIDFIFQELSLESFTNEIKLSSKGSVDVDSDHYGMGKTAVLLSQDLSKSFKLKKRPIVFAKHGGGPHFEGIKLYTGGHPYPDHETTKNGQVLLDNLQMKKDCSTLVLGLTGGASSIIDILPESIEINFVRALQKELLLSGAGIEEINSLRQEFSLLKNGGLLSLSSSRVFHTFIVSDIPTPNYLKVGSSPTFYSPTKTSYLKELANDYLKGELRSKVLKFIDSPMRTAVLSPKEKAQKDKESYYHLLCDYKKLMKKLEKKLGQQFFYRENPLNDLIGEAIDIHLKEVLKFKGRNLLKSGFTFLTGGETPVKVLGKGIGGRNTEFVLRLSREFFGKNVLCLSEDDLKKLWIASFATDGTDGDTLSAGAWMDYDSYQEISIKGLDVDLSLKNNDSHTFFKKLGNLIETGPRGINIMDLRIIQMG